MTCFLLTSCFCNLAPYFHEGFLLPPTQISRKRGAVETTWQYVELFLTFLLPFFLFSLSSPFSSVPLFCLVTDGFNYPLTLRTQQIHVINWACDCCGHRLEAEVEQEKEEGEGEELLLPQQGGGGVCRCAEEERTNSPSLDPVDSYLVSKGSHPFFFFLTLTILPP